MKKLLLGLIICMLVLTPSVYSASEVVNFQWDANQEQDLAGYRLYVSNTPNPTKSDVILVKSVLAPTTSTTASVSGTEGQTIYFVLTAYDSAGNESEFSNECPFTFEDIAPASPGGFTCSKQEAQ